MKRRNSFLRLRRPGIRTLFCFTISLGVLTPGELPAADLRDARALKIIQTTESTFPPDLAARGVKEGEVHAVLHVGAEGKLLDCLIASYTHRELADELLANLKEWRFEPAYQRGEPVHTRFEAVFSFSAKGSVISLSAIDPAATHAAQLIRERPTSLICKLHELDQPLSRVQVVQPLHPGKSLGAAQAHGSVSVDFYIDAEGRPRMPIITRASHEAFALSALAALEQWRFAPPTRAGQPTAVRVVQEFRF